jgi:O-antigen ligase
MVDEFKSTSAPHEENQKNNPMGPPKSKQLSMVHVAILSGLIAMASVNTKIAGAAWLSIVLVGAYTLFRRLWVPRGGLPVPERVNNPVSSAATTWFLFATLALTLKAVAVLYWDSGWEERHAEIRLFLGALGSLGLAGYYVRNRSQTLLVLGLCCAGLAAFALVFLHGGDGAPTNRIPWASGMSLLILASLGAAFTVGRRQRTILVLCSGLATFGVIAFSDTRGAYPVGLIWIIALFSMRTATFRDQAKAQRTAWGTKTKSWLAMGSISLAILPVLYLQGSLESAYSRVETATSELGAYMQGDDSSINTSVGARLHMWSLSVPVIVDNVPWGVGKDERAAQIRRWGVELNSPVIQSLGHLHNEYLQTLLENGLWGLASFLSYTAGMLFAARRLWKCNLKVSSKGLVAIAAMHSLAELTNMNFAHNYYPTLLSLSVAIALIFAQVEAQKQGMLARKI